MRSYTSVYGTVDLSKTSVDKVCFCIMCYTARIDKGPNQNKDLLARWQVCQIHNNVSVILKAGSDRC